MSKLIILYSTFCSVWLGALACSNADSVRQDAASQARGAQAEPIIGSVELALVDGGVGTLDGGADAAP
jgi:hypothetical protein